MTLEELLKAATPGPWKLVPDEYGEPAQCLQSYGFDIATLWGGYNAGEANASLVVKAPDIAAALIEAEKALIVLAVDPRDETVCPGNGWDYYTDAVNFSRATLARIRAITGGDTNGKP